MLAFVYRSVKYAKRADVKLSVHILLSFSSCFLLACVRTFYVVLLLLTCCKSSYLVSYFQTSLTVISQLLQILLQMKRNITIVLIGINVRARGSK